MSCGKTFKKITKFILPVAAIALAAFAGPALFGAGAAAGGGAAAAGGAAALGAGEAAGLGLGGALIDGGLSTGIASTLGAGASAGALAGGAGIATGAGALLGEAGLGALGSGALAAGASAAGGAAASSGIGSLLSGLTVKDALSGAQAVSQLVGSAQKQPKPVAADEQPQPQEVAAPKTQAETLYQPQLSPNSQNLSANIGGGTGVGNLLSKTTDKNFSGSTLLAELFGDKKKLGGTGKLA